MSLDKTDEQQEELERIATEHEQAGMRQVATEQVQSEAALRRIAQHSRGRDKSVYRITQRKLQEMRDELAQQVDLQQQMDTLCEQMQTLADASYSPEYSTRWQHLQKLWHENRDYMSDAQQQLADQSAKTILQRERENPAGGLLNQYRDLNTKAIGLYTDMVRDRRFTSPEEMQRIAEQMQQLRQMLQDSNLLVDKAPDWNALERVQDLLQACERLGQFIKTLPRCRKASDFSTAMEALAWPADLPEPEVLQNAHEAMEEQQGILQQQREQAHRNREQASALVQEIHAVLDDGQVKRARELIPRVRALELREHQKRQVEHALKRAQRRIRELADWNRYAIEPKKEELCQQMEAMSENVAPVDAQTLKQRAALITQLQKQWRELDKGSLGSSGKLWQRFQIAGNKAWEPCGAHFSQVEQQAQDLLEQLDALASLPAEEIHPKMRSLMGEWKNLQPLPQASRKRLHGKMDQRLQQLDVALKPMQQTWRRSKLQIIKKAEQLSQGKPGGRNSKSIDSAKALQADWKRVPALPREENENLWTKFREACDKVFAQADEQRKEQRGKQAESEQQAGLLINELDALLQLEDAEFLNAENKATGLLDSLREFDLRKSDKQKKYRSLEKAVRRRVQQLQASQSQQHYEHLGQFSQQCSKQELLALQGKPAGLDKLALPELPAALRTLAQKRLENAEQVLQMGKKYDTESLLQELHNLTVRVEIAADVPSPDADAAVRLQIKAQNMKLSLEGGQALPDTNTLYQQWLQSPFCGKNAEERKSLKGLQERFNQAVATLGNKDTSEGKKPSVKAK